MKKEWSNEISAICTKRNNKIQYFVTNIYIYPHQILRRCILAISDPVVYDVVKLAFRNCMVINKKQFSELTTAYRKHSKNIISLIRIDFDKEVFHLLTQGGYRSCSLELGISIAEAAYKGYYSENFSTNQYFMEWMLKASTLKPFHNT